MKAQRAEKAKNLPPKSAEYTEIRRKELFGDTRLRP
jgi:hypothetical protein